MERRVVVYLRIDYTIIHVWHIVQNLALLLFPVAAGRIYPTRVT